MIGGGRDRLGDAHHAATPQPFGRRIRAACVLRCKNAKRQFAPPFRGIFLSRGSCVAGIWCWPSGCRYGLSALANASTTEPWAMVATRSRVEPGRHAINRIRFGKMLFMLDPDNTPTGSDSSRIVGRGVRQASVFTLLHVPTLHIFTKTYLMAKPQRNFTPRRHHRGNSLLQCMHQCWSAPHRAASNARILRRRDKTMQRLG